MGVVVLFDIVEIGVVKHDQLEVDELMKYYAVNSLRALYC